MSIERHRLQREKNAGAYMEPAADGNWVTFADHAAELARVEGERDANRRLLNKALKENALLRAECAAWRKRRQLGAKVITDGNDASLTGSVCAYDRADKALDQARAATDAAGALKGVE